jgi:crotonobetainyl-CoA:carnitine CoA-transferase CaiB-like acyl-CoA transferase
VRWIAAGLLAAAGAIVTLYMRRQIGRGQLALLVSMSALLLYFVTAVQDLRARLSPEPAFASQIRALVADEPVAFLGGARDALRYYVGGDLTFRKTKEIAAALRFSGEHMLVACDESCIGQLPDDRYVTCLEVLRHEAPPLAASLDERSRFVLMRCVKR